ERGSRSVRARAGRGAGLPPPSPPPLRPRAAASLAEVGQDRKSTRLNSSHLVTSYAVICLKKKSMFDAASTSALTGSNFANPAETRPSFDPGAVPNTGTALLDGTLHARTSACLDPALYLLS